MGIPDIEVLKAKLEATGEAGVREKLAAGLYGESKVKIIKEWLIISGVRSDFSPTKSFI